MSPSDKYLGRSFLGDEQLRAMVSSGEQREGSTETIREGSFDYSPRSPQDKRLAQTWLVKNRVSLQRGNARIIRILESGREAFVAVVLLRSSVRCGQSSRNIIRFSFGSRNDGSTRRRVAAVGWGQDLIVAKRRDHRVNICVNFQPGYEGPLSALLNDLEWAIKQGEGKDDEEAQGSGGENDTEAYEGEVEGDTEACERESMSEDEGVEAEESEYGSGDESEDETGKGNEAEEN
ncbi:unnamed protein product [Clonostachys chloroleuca]|uniref:Uncharacterized protein n=1 Tax=Clonostachys chloroleuca TaxID=1926264 RepID=A0AA35M3K3_9HYPO|nr:unnamed protein product [Clonostachys chloroleuca]